MGRWMGGWSIPAEQSDPGRGLTWSLLHLQCCVYSVGVAGIGSSSSNSFELSRLMNEVCGRQEWGRQEKDQVNGENEDRSLACEHVNISTSKK